MTNEQILKFLQESNAIEDVYDADSLFQAFVAWEYLMKQDELSHGAILKIHKILMLHQKHLKECDRGHYRTCDVRIGYKTICPDYRLVRNLMDEWIKVWGNDLKEEWIKAHVEFERIHPFVDGNGRVGRMLMNWQIVKLGHRIHVIEEKYKELYYDWFN